MRLRAVFGLLLAPLLFSAPAHATFPGANGKIAFARSGNIYTVNPDGSDEQAITSGSSNFFLHPAWSPDGKQIAFGDFTRLWIANADGSNAHSILTSGGQERISGRRTGKSL